MARATQHSRQSEPVPAGAAGGRWLLPGEVHSLQGGAGGALPGGLGDCQGVPAGSSAPGGGCARQRPGGGNVNEWSVTELVRYTDPGDPAGGGTAALGAGKALRDPQGLSGTPRPQWDPNASAGPCLVSGVS